MKKEWAQKWVAALRSGKYKQGSHALQQDGKFCCLGVLCDITGTPETDVNFGRGEYGWLANCEKIDNTSVLPSSTVDKTGMKSIDGRFDGGSLLGLNDSGTTFEEIADIIEKNWELL